MSDKINYLIKIFLLMSVICGLLFIVNATLAYEPKKYLSEPDMDYLNRDIKDHPNSCWVYITRGRAYINLYKYTEALNDFDKAIKMKKNNELDKDCVSTGYLLKTYPYLGLGNSEKALLTIKKSIETAPKRYPPVFYQAVTFDYREEAVKAVSYYTDYLFNVEKEKNQYIFALKRRSVNFYKLNKYNEALKDIESISKVIALDNDLKNAYIIIKDLIEKPENKIKLDDKILKLDIKEVISL